jgi:hypothetical protein
MNRVYWPTPPPSTSLANSGRNVQADQRRLPLHVREPACELLAHAPARRRRDVAHVQREDRDDHREKRQAVQAEAGHHAERGQRGARYQRPDHAGEVELDRVERNRVRDVRLLDERGKQ